MWQKDKTTLRLTGQHSNPILLSCRAKVIR